MNQKASALAAPPLKPTTHRLPSDRWHVAEIVFWLLPVAAYFLFPGHRVLASQIMIVGLFALSLDLILGYAGIVSLGHAAFFGVGAYTAALLAVHGWGEPLTGLLLAGVVAARRRLSRQFSGRVGIRHRAPDGDTWHLLSVLRSGQ